MSGQSFSFFADHSRKQKGDSSQRFGPKPDTAPPTLFMKIRDLLLWMLTCTASTAPAQEDGVRAILFANPLVRWVGTVHKQGVGDLWVFYCGSDDIKVLVPEGTSERGFLAAKRVASRAVLSWLEQPKNPRHMPPLRAPGEMPPSPQMQAFAQSQNKIFGGMFSYTPIGQSDIKGQTYWRFYVRSKLAGDPDVVVTTPEGIPADVFNALHFGAMAAVADYAARHPEEANRTK